MVVGGSSPATDVVITVEPTRGEGRSWSAEARAAVRNNGRGLRGWITEEAAWLVAQFLKVAVSVAAFGPSISSSARGSRTSLSTAGLQTYGATVTERLKATRATELEPSGVALQARSRIARANPQPQEIALRTTRRPIRRDTSARSKGVTSTSTPARYTQLNTGPARC
jgi:hypothetical protein